MQHKINNVAGDNQGSLYLKDKLNK